MVAVKERDTVFLGVVDEEILRLLVTEVVCDTVIVPEALRVRLTDVVLDTVTVGLLD